MNFLTTAESVGGRVQFQRNQVGPVEQSQRERFSEVRRLQACRVSLGQSVPGQMGRSKVDPVFADSFEVRMALGNSSYAGLYVLREILLANDFVQAAIPFAQDVNVIRGSGIQFL